MYVSSSSNSKCHDYETDPAAEDLFGSQQPYDLKTPRPIVPETATFKLEG